MLGPGSSLTDQVASKSVVNHEAFEADHREISVEVQGEMSLRVPYCFSFESYDWILSHIIRGMKSFAASVLPPIHVSS